MTLSTSRVLSTDSKSGLSTFAPPTNASTAVPPRAGLGTVATGWHPINTSTSTAAPVESRLREMRSHPDERERADQEGGDQHPGGPVDLALETSAGAIATTGSVAASADGSPEARSLGRLDQHAGHQKNREDGLRDDERLLNLSHWTRRFYLRPHGAEARLNRVPVERVEPGRDVVRPLVLVLQVVRVLPHVDAHDRRHPFHEGAVLVRIRLDGQLAVLVGDQPRPTTAELAHTGLRELLLERVVAPERAFQSVADSAAGVAAAAGTHDAPEDGVVRVPAGVVPDRGPDVLGHLVDAPEQVLDRPRPPLRVLLERGIGIVHVSRVVLVVMDLHGLGVDVRLEGIERVRKRRNYKWHGGNPPFFLNLSLSYESV